ncbi:hypothetical protein ACQ4PT_000840 [Festuca glaucescens]
MSTDHEVTTVVETADVQCNAAITGCEVITGGDTVDVLHNAATAGGEVVTGSDVCNVQYNAAAAGAQPVSSFTVDSSHDHVAMATSSALAGDKTIHAPDERASTFTAIQSSSNLSTLKASSTMANSNEVHGTSSELLVPKIGMAFKSEEDAYEFYNEYADQCAAMAKAIDKVFPGTKHRLCLWHIYQNAAKHLNHVISNHPRFLADFKRVVYLENSVAYFEKKWQELLITY